MAGALKTALEPLGVHLHVDREPGVRPRGPCIKSMEDTLVLVALGTFDYAEDVPGNNANSCW